MSESAAPSRPDEANARRALRALWGEADVELRPLFGDVDVNLRVEAADGSRSVLKFVDPGIPDDELAMQAAALDHLAERLPEGTVPRVIRTVSGEVVADFEGWRVRRLSWIEGPTVSEALPRAVRGAPAGLPPLYRDLGRFLAELDRALEGFTHPAADRPHSWNPLDALGLAERLHAVTDPSRRALLDRVLASWTAEVVPRSARLPRAPIHADGHELNVIVDRVAHPTRVVGIFDFGDMLETARVCEPAVAAAYAAMQTPDPLDGIAAVVAGYDAVLPLGDDELAVVVELVRTRLAISVSFSAQRRGERDDPYASISEAGGWRVLEALDEVAPELAVARVRHACGREVRAGAAAVALWLDANRSGMAPALPEAVCVRPVALDLSVDSPLLRGDPARMVDGGVDRILRDEVARREGTVGIGRWNEARALLLGPEFAAPGAPPTAEHRTVHMGVDLFAPSGTPVHAPLAGTIDAVGRGRWGGSLLLRHRPAEGVEFRTLWSRLDAEVIGRFEAGDAVAAGAPLGRIAPAPEATTWPPHLHLQIVLDEAERGCAIDGVAPARLRDFGTALHPNPAALLGMHDTEVAAPARSAEELVRRRARTMGANLSLSYDSPIEAVRGWRHHLWDAEGRCWLDLYNNVPHVGHAHPRVVEAIARQSALFAANTRYLSGVRQDYLDRLLARFPDPLDTVFLLPSASEANEVALRLARAFTGRREVIVQEAAYHGHTTTLIEVSPYKAAGPGGEGVPEWVEVVPIPDPYRGVHRSTLEGPDLHRDESVGGAYAAEVAGRVERMVAEGRPPGAFLAETMPSVGGQIVPPRGYLAGAWEAVRRAGGIAIADEVQTGFGRLGGWFWGFEQQGVVPDVVVLGKPIANGFPMGAVVTRREIADAFANGMEFFSTTGGNPVACAAGTALLDVLEKERLQANAERVGAALLDGLRSRSADHPCIGEVRGLGLFLGVQTVRDRESREPAPGVARYLVRRLMEEGVLAGTDGPHHDVVKLRGPLTVDAAAVEVALDVWARILAEPGSRSSG